MIIELGRLAYEVKLKEVGEKKVLNNRLAIPIGKDKTTFVDIVAWNGTAELIANNFKKGHEILIQGHLINKKGMKEKMEYDTIAILVDKIVFTHGNPKVA